MSANSEARASSTQPTTTMGPRAHSRSAIGGKDSVATRERAQRLATLTLQLERKSVDSARLPGCAVDLE